MRGFKWTLDEFAKWREQNRPSITTAVIEVSEKYARRVLHIKKDKPLAYRGLSLKCIGSKAWRNENA